MVLRKRFRLVEILFVLVRVVSHSVLSVKDLFCRNLQCLCPELHTKFRRWDIRHIRNCRQHFSDWNSRPINRQSIAICILNRKPIPALLIWLASYNNVINLNLNPAILTPRKRVIFLLNAYLTLLDQVLCSFVKLYPLLFFIVDNHCVIVPLYDFVTLLLCTAQ